MDAPNNKAQIKELISMYPKILDFFTLKAVSMIVPPIGVSIKGVSAAIPAGPNFLQVLTIVLFRLVIFFSEIFKVQFDLNHSPK